MKIESESELEHFRLLGKGAIYNDFVVGGSATSDILHGAACGWVARSNTNVAKFFFESTDEGVAWLEAERGPEGVAWKRCGTCRGDPAVARILWGDRLGEFAYHTARRLDPGRDGLRLEGIRAGLEHGEFKIRGENPATVLSAAMNRRQDLFEHASRGTWRWLPRPDAAAAAEGLSGALLAEEAFRVARRLDPDALGLWYQDIRAALVDEGTIIRGPNPGQTIVAALGGSSDLFESLERGRYRWKLG